MRLAEELALVLLNEDSGYFEPVGAWNLSCVIAGSVLADLSLEFRIDTDTETLTLLDAKETGDPLLDPVLEEIASAPPPVHNAQYWIEKTAQRSDDAMDIILDRLVEKNILDHDSGGFWSLSRQVSRTGTYSADDGSTKLQVKTRVLRAILDEEIPDPRDVILISLIAACDALPLLLTEEEYEESRERIDLLCRMDLVGRAIGAAVRESQGRPVQQPVGRTRPIPVANLLKLIPNRNLRRGNLSRILTDLYREYGPVFRIKKPFSEKGVVVLAGPDTNAWINRNGRTYFRTRDHMADFEQLYGASRTLPGMDGTEHYRMRKSLRAGYSRATLEARLDEVYKFCRASLEKWVPGKPMPGAAACQELMSVQVSQLMVGVDASDHIDDLLSYEHRSLVTHVQKALPKFMMQTPGMARKRKRIFEMLNRVLNAHTPAQRKGKPKDLVDHILSLHASDPQYFPETDLSFMLVAGFIASIYLGSGLSFAVYGMASHPEIYRRVQKEAEALFANGDPGKDDFTRSTIDVAHRVFLESQRLYPVIPMQLRTTMNHCVVQGYNIPKDTRVVFAHTAAHHLEETFPDPTRFDIDRYAPPRDEHKRAGAYVPFGLGTHHCLGSKWVELQMTINLLLIAYYFDISVVPSDYEMRFNPFPTSAPNSKFRFTIDKRRHDF